MPSKEDALSLDDGCEDERRAGFSRLASMAVFSRSSSALRSFAATADAAVDSGGGGGGGCDVGGDVSASSSSSSSSVSLSPRPCHEAELRHCRLMENAECTLRVLLITMSPRPS